MKHIIFDYVCNILDSLFLLKYFCYRQNKNIRYRMFIIPLILDLLTTALPMISINIVIDIIIHFSLIIIFFRTTKFVNLINLAKYEIIRSVSYISLYILHSIIMWDFNTIIVSSYYIQYKSVICYSLTFILFTLYINSKKIKILNRKYEYSFNGIIITSLFILSYTTLYICKNIPADNYVFPLLFTTIYILIAICVNLYDRFIIILNENIESKISSEKARLEADYSENLDAKLKELHSIRHDIKNHLIIIDGYIKSNHIDNARKYIQNIYDYFEDTYIVDTPCSSINNILNAKYQLCLNNDIKFNFHYLFSDIIIDDYSLITILGNLLDNAITASAKLDADKRIIELSIRQIASYLEIRIENNHKETIRKLGNEFISTKEKNTRDGNSSFHGIGLKNVRLTTNQLNGHLQIDYTDTTFKVSVILPNY